jgi:ABC-2 type transport system ATP-binding protein
MNINRHTLPGQSDIHCSSDDTEQPRSAGDASLVVQVRGFAKSYGRNQAVKEANLQIHRGEIYGLIGPDGAGKSSLMKAIAGVLTYDAGTVTVFDQLIDSERAAEKIKGRLGLMPQGLGQNLYGDLSIEENIDFFARIRMVPAKELAERKQRLLAMTRLDTFRHRPMKQLSGGMKQKLGLVCTLIHEPDLIILDEPTTGVDPVSRRDFWAILAALLNERGITALVSTAYMDEATRFQRLSLMFAGGVLAEGEPEAIVRLVPGTVVAMQSDQQTEALARLKENYPQVDAYGARLRVFVENPETGPAQAEIEKALDGIACHDVQTTEPELEDVFIALLRKKNLAEPQSESKSEEAKEKPQEKSKDTSRAGQTSPDTQEIAIEAKGLVRLFDDFRAVDDVSFRVPQGEIFGLLGANGAGKTTVIKMLTGILPPSGGEGQVAGADMRTAGQAIKERIGYMSQAFSLYLDLTVLENIRLYAGIYGLNRRESAERLSWVVDMAALAGHEKDLAGSLPMGLRQRLALGCALVHKPRILFLDEPTSGVDPVGRRHFWEILFRLSRQDGVAILVTTHYMGEAEHCDHLALMFAGRVVADATPAAMKAAVEAEAGHLYELITDQPAAAMDHLVKEGFPEAALFGKRIHILCRKPEEDRKRIEAILSTAGLAIDGFAARPLSMEDVFVYRVTSLEQKGHEAAGGDRQ